MKNLPEIGLVLKMEPQNITHLTSAGVVASVLICGDVSATTKIDRTDILNQKIQRYNIS